MTDAARSMRRKVLAKHPHFFAAVLADARATAANRGERFEFRSTFDAIGQMIRLSVVSDAFLAQVLYRAKARMQALGIPILPRLAHRLAMMVAQVSIGDPVVVQPGLYLAHGQVVIDGFTTVEANVVISPWVTIGLRAPDIHGPTIGRGARIGTGAKVIGPVKVGAGARIGANSVVISDIPPRVTAVGSPARVVE